MIKFRPNDATTAASQPVRSIGAAATSPRARPIDASNAAPPARRIDPDTDALSPARPIDAAVAIEKVR